jgi:hypothetical protein
MTFCASTALSPLNLFSFRMCRSISSSAEGVDHAALGLLVGAARLGPPEKGRDRASRVGTGTSLPRRARDPQDERRRPADLVIRSVFGYWPQVDPARRVRLHDGPYGLVPRRGPTPPCSRRPSIHRHRAPANAGRTTSVRRRVVVDWSAAHDAPSIHRGGVSFCARTTEKSWHPREGHSSPS